MSSDRVESAAGDTAVPDDSVSTEVEVEPRERPAYLDLLVRLSWFLLAIGLLGHVYAFLVADGGVVRLGFTFLTARWADPLWRVWDVATLWLVTLHGGAAIRSLVEDYASQERTRSGFRLLVLVLTVVVLAIGTYTVVTFDPTLE